MTLLARLLDNPDVKAVRFPQITGQSGKRTYEPDPKPVKKPKKGKK